MFKCASGLLHKAYPLKAYPHKILPRKSEDTEIAPTQSRSHAKECPAKRTPSDFPPKFLHFLHQILKYRKRFLEKIGVKKHKIRVK